MAYRGGSDGAAIAQAIDVTERFVFGLRLIAPEGRGKRLLFGYGETESEAGAAASEEGRECLRSRATEFRAKKHFVTSTFQKILQKFRNRIS